MAVSKNARKLYWAIFDGLETKCANFISNYSERKRLKKYKTDTPMPKSFKNNYVSYWKKYVSSSKARLGAKFAWQYASKNKIKDPRYVPSTLMLTKIDQHFNDRKLGWGFNDKNYYDLIFSTIKQPKTIVRKINGMLFDAEYKQIQSQYALDLIKNQQEVICKPALETGSGRDIRFWNTTEKEDEIKAFLCDFQQSDYIIQEVVHQHSSIEKIHPSSLNTLRIAALLMNDGVHILSSCLRMGVDGGRIDNFSAGGISCGINQDGTLKKYAYAINTGQKFETHPQGFMFDGFQIPNYSKAIDLVKKAHPLIGHFRLVSWDIAIDINGEPILIEANMRKGGINVLQYSNGPVFGDLTDTVLEEVFLNCK